MRKHGLIPMNLQLFAEGSEGNQGAQGGQGNSGSEGNQGAAGNQGAQPIDYEKLAGMIAGKEDGILKGYLKQQGLTKEEMEAAVKQFKDEKAARTPDVSKLQSDLNASAAALRTEMVKSAATMAAFVLGIDAKTVPYVLKLADLSNAVDSEGKINEETIKKALNKVLEDIPGLKPSAQGENGGFLQFGNTGGGGKPNSEVDDQLDRIFGVKKK